MALSSTASANVWARYEAQVHARCPSRHIELFQDDYDDLLTGYIDALSDRTQKAVQADFKYTGRCTRENFGGSCEMYTYLVTFERLKLLRGFSAYSCKYWTCDYAAFCHVRSQKPELAK